MANGTYRPDSYGESFAEVYDEWYGDLNDAAAVARFVAARAGSGPVLELGVGTGRLALPLAAAGTTVVGLDASPSMLARCRDRYREQIRGGRLLLVRADMAHLPFGPGAGCGFGAVLISFNTLFNLLSEGDQRSLVAQAAAVLAPGGALVVEANQVEALASGPHRWLGPVSVDGDHRRLTVAATVIDHEAQTITGRHVDVDDHGVRLRPWRLRWSTVVEIDRFAADAGLTLAERWGDWDGTPFTPGGDRHVSVYRVAGPGGIGGQGAGGNPPTAAS